MKRMLLLSLAAAVALPLAAQQQAAANAPSVATTAAASPTADPVVAMLNGETITASKLDSMYNRLSPSMKEQYNSTGGKAGFLDNYLRKRLLVQEALKQGFDKRPEVQAEMETAKESALFDRYVRDVVASQIVTDAVLKKYYDDHLDEFNAPERVKVRHILIMANGAGPRPKTKDQALELIKQVAAELHEKIATVRAADPATQARIRLSYFETLARKYSEDGTAEAGGDLGWQAKGGGLDPQFEEVAFKLEPGTPSGIVETKFGYHIIWVEDKEPAGRESLDHVKPILREYLLAQHAADVMQAVTRLTNELRANSKMSIYPENIR
jgi:peptidyl-prolyl cis-trans isomerase C